jgi:hypothetical protein
VCRSVAYGSCLEKVCNHIKLADAKNTVQHPQGCVHLPSRRYGMRVTMCSWCICMV